MNARRNNKEKRKKQKKTLDSKIMFFRLKCYEIYHQLYYLSKIITHCCMTIWTVVMLLFVTFFFSHTHELYIRKTTTCDDNKQEKQKKNYFFSFVSNNTICYWKRNIWRRISEWMNVVSDMSLFSAYFRLYSLTCNKNIYIWEKESLKKLLSHEIEIQVSDRVNNKLKTEYFSKKARHTSAKMRDIRWARDEYVFPKKKNGKWRKKNLRMWKFRVMNKMLFRNNNLQKHPRCLLNYMNFFLSPSLTLSLSSPSLCVSFTRWNFW